MQISKWTITTPYVHSVRSFLLIFCFISHCYHNWRVDVKVMTLLVEKEEIIESDWVIFTVFIRKSIQAYKSLLLRISQQLTNAGLRGTWPLNWCMCVCVFSFIWCCIWSWLFTVWSVLCPSLLYNESSYRECVAACDCDWLNVGRPYPVVVTSPREGLDGREYVVTWETPVDGGLPITEYEFKYRRVCGQLAFALLW